MPVSEVRPIDDEGRTNLQTLRREFLGVMFDALDRSEIDYCVLRGFDSLIEGTGDVDLLVRPTDFPRIAKLFVTCCRDNALYPARSAIQLKSLYLTAVKIDEENPTRLNAVHLHFVVFVSLHLTTWQRRVVGASTRYWLDDFRTRSIEHQGLNFNVPDELHEFLFLLNHLPGKPKLAYKKRCRYLLEEPVVNNVVRQVLGPDANIEVAACIEKAEHCDYLRALLGKLVGATRPNIRPLALVLVLANHLRFAFRRNGSIVFFSGPDGAGKTTTSIRLAELLRHCGLEVRSPKNLYFFYRRSRIVGRVQAKIRNIDANNMQRVERDRGRGASWRFRRLLGLLSILTQYFPGFMYARCSAKRGRQWVVETSVLDAFVKGHRPRFPWLEIAMLPVLPRGDIHFVLMASPRAIVARKPELTIGELESYYHRLDKYLVLTKTHPVRIAADDGIEGACAIVFRISLQRIHRMQEHCWIGPAREGS